MSRSVFCLFLFPVRFQFPVATSLFPDFPVCRHCRQAPSVAPAPATPVASVAAAAPTAPTATTASTTSTIPLEEVSKAENCVIERSNRCNRCYLVFLSLYCSQKPKTPRDWNEDHWRSTWQVISGAVRTALEETPQVDTPLTELGARCRILIVPSRCPSLALLSPGVPWCSLVPFRTSCSCSEDGLG